MSNPLTGVDLIDCARANAKHGIQTAAEQCGYGDNLEQFHQALIEAGQNMGLKIESIDSLVADEDSQLGPRSIEIAPRSFDSL